MQTRHKPPHRVANTHPSCFAAERKEEEEGGKEHSPKLDTSCGHLQFELMRKARHWHTAALFFAGHHVSSVRRWRSHAPSSSSAAANLRAEVGWGGVGLDKSCPSN